MKPILEFPKSEGKTIRVYKGLEICQYIVKINNLEVARFADDVDLINYLYKRMEK